MISYKYNIYHSKKTKYLEKMLRECCFVWNHALALQRRYYRLFGKYISVGKMQKHFSKRIKRNLLHSQTVQEILHRLDSSYNRFFKKLAKRPPKFKSPEKFNSFVFKQGGFTLNGNCLTINKGKKRFRFSYSRVYEGNVKQIRIVRETCSRFSLIIITDHNHSNSKQYDYIFIEDLNIEGMKRLWGKKVSDLSHSSFINKLTYVALKYGVIVHKIDKWYPSSKTCECGCINKGLSLRDRTWVCPACGAVNDRDVLAARNILRKGISELESMGNSGCRNAGVPYVCIQESRLL